MNGLSLEENIELLISEIKRDISLSNDVVKEHKIKIEVLQQTKSELQKILDHYKKATN